MISKIPSNIDAYQLFVFELDNVLFPRKDYILQIIYLFSHFIEYTNPNLSASTCIDYAKKCYEKDGEKNLFEKCKQKFDLDPKFQKNFEQLFYTARLPLKLLLFQKVLDFMKSIQAQNKEIWIMTKGPIEEQLNKIKQIEWNGLEKYIKVYFVAEHPENNKALYLESLMAEHQIAPNQTLFVAKDTDDKNISKLLDLHFLALENF